VTKGKPCNSWLEFKGEYVGPEVEKAMLAAGWRRQKHGAPRMPEGTLEPGMTTDVFCQPPGGGLFGGSTEDEGERNMAAARKALDGFRVELGRPRKARWQDLA